METSLIKERRKSILFLVIAASLLSTGGILIKLIDWNPLAISGARGYISALVVLIYLRKPKFTFSKAQIIGAISYATMVTCFVVSNKLTTAANAVLLQFTAPIFVAILSVWILKEKMHWYDWSSIVIVGVGMILFFLDDLGGGSRLGNLIAIFGGVALAGVTISMRLQKDESTLETVLLGHIITGLVLTPFIFQNKPNTTSIVVIIIMGVFQLGIAYTFFSLAIKNVSAIEAIIIMLVEPILNPLWVFIFAKEAPSLYALIGGAIVIVTLTARGIIAGKNTLKEST